MDEPQQPPARTWSNLHVGRLHVAASGTRVRVSFGGGFDASRMLPSLHTVVGTNAAMAAASGMGLDLGRMATLVIVVAAGGLVGIATPRPATVATWVSSVVAVALVVTSGEHTAVAALVPLSAVGVGRELLGQASRRDRSS